MNTKPFSPWWTLTGTLILIGLVTLVLFTQSPTVQAQGTPVVVTGVHRTLSDMQTAQAQITPGSGIRQAPDPLRRPTSAPNSVLVAKAPLHLDMSWLNALIVVLLKLLFGIG